MFGALGDIHGDFGSVDRILALNADVPFWVCVGDVAATRAEYREPAAPIYFIKGNNEDFDFLEEIEKGSGATGAQLRYVPNGVVVTVDGLRIAGLGGTFAPTWYDTPAAELPHPGTAVVRPRRPAKPGKASTADKRRHFVREQVEACKRFHSLDLFLSHEAPRPFFVRPRLDAGRRRSTR
jgi:hypothetical protein